MATDAETLTMLRAIRGDLALLRELLEDQRRRMGLLEMRMIDLNDLIQQALSAR